MFTVDILEHVAHLRLRQVLRVQHPRELFAFLLLVTEDCQYLRMKVAVAVAGYLELQALALIIGASRTVSVPLVPDDIPAQELPALRHHHTFQHDRQ